MLVRVSGGVLVSIRVAPAASEEEIPEDLTQKYGPPDKRFNVRCVSQESGTGTDISGRTVTIDLPPVTHDAIGLAWTKLPGLHVQYEPFDPLTNCRNGVIRAELAGWYKLNAEAATRARAAGPKM